jgi:hypothetical protein
MTMAICCTCFRPALALDSLADGFQNPPDVAKPRTFWYWTNGNITKQGIKLDLEWMHRIGIGGAPGDSLSGGPWVKPEQSMKKLVWSETRVRGPVSFRVVNEKTVGILWKAPFRLDLTDALVANDNRITIKVTNLWPNRLIGDKQAGARKIAFVTFDPFKADSPLLPSGLIGPVRLFRASTR